MSARKPALLWVYDVSLAGMLPRATWLETAAGLCDLDWQVTLVAVDVPWDELDERISVICLPRPRVYILGHLLFHLRLLCRLTSLCRRTDVILFHQNSALFLLPIVFWRRLAGWDTPKIVMDTRSVPMITSSIRGKLWEFYFNVAHRLANRLADGQTAITSRMVQAVRIPEWQFLGSWPSGVKTEQFGSATAVRQWSKREDPLRLIYIGSLHSDRHLLELCEAVQMVNAEDRRVTLTLIGKGPDRSELERYACDRGKGAIVVGPPTVLHGEIPGLLAMADVGVLPFPDEPKYRVSSPVKLFEYMAAGMPVLATRVVCHTDVLSDSDFVFWAEDGSPKALAAAIREAYDRKAELSAMGQSAAQSARNWTWAESAKKLDAALRRIIH